MNSTLLSENPVFGKPFVVSLSNHEWPFDKLRANGFRFGDSLK
jgi:hypothetical protein